VGESCIVQVIGVLFGVTGSGGTVQGTGVSREASVAGRERLKEKLTKEMGTP
jgi:hypothetical protein